MLYRLLYVSEKGKENLLQTRKGKTMKKMRKVFMEYGYLMAEKETFCKDHPEYADDMRHVCADMPDIFRYVSGEDEEPCFDVAYFKAAYESIRKIIHTKYDMLRVIKEMGGDDV